MQANKMKRKPENLIGVGITIGVVLSLVYYGMNVAKEHLPIKDGKDIIANYSDVLPYNLPSSIEKKLIIRLIISKNINPILFQVNYPKFHNLKIS